MKEHVTVEEKWNKKGYLVSIKVDGQVIDLPEQHQPSVHFLKKADWVIEKFWLTPEEAKNRFPYLKVPTPH